MPKLITSKEVEYIHESLFECVRKDIVYTLEKYEKEIAFLRSQLKKNQESIGLTEKDLYIDESGEYPIETYKCPSCGECRISHSFNYCPICGIKIKVIE